MAETPPNVTDAGLELLFGRRVYIETYGCRYNFGDTAKLVEILIHHGSTVVSTDGEADAIVVNTCTVVGPTERRMLRRLSQFRDRTLFVTGCMPAVQADAIRSVCNPVFIDPESIQQFYRQVNTVTSGDTGIVQLAQGCMGKCTYCITRFARGPLKSFTAVEIHDQVRAFARAGTAEIQLTAQDVSAWGRDTGETLPGLLRQISDIPPPALLRVGMMNPATVIDILDDLVDAFLARRIFRFIHLPAQSGSDAILARMGRQYTVDEYEEIVQAFRKRIPDITLMTDMIVGFSRETEDEFTDSLALVERIHPNKVNVTRYSQRPFTPLATEKDFPDSVKKDRSRLMNQHAERIYAEINDPLIGTTVPFVVTEAVRPGSVMARSPAYLGIVINENLPVGFAGNARLKKDRKYFFIGERVT
ncbi:MAG: radical SAM protein [Methanoregula sp.]|jgi:MiaB/RimO family radical SAM methylthiotransferase|nr:radical SAM protein [Methanoregula sp.]